MGTDQHDDAQDDPAPSNRPRRVWDGTRWVESLTVCRDELGRYVNKRGDEPPSQLVLPFPGNGAA